MPSATSAAIGWSVVFLVAGGFYFVSSLRKNKNRRTLPTKGNSNSADSRRESKPKKARKDVGSARDKSEARLNRTVHQNSINIEPSQIILVPTSNTELNDSGAINKISNARGATAAGEKSPISHKSKPPKKGHAQEVKGFTEEKQRAESSDNATGNEADDESVINFPKLGVATPKSLSTTQDISDMLEKPITKPSVLRVTAPTSIKVNQPENRRNNQKVELVETKKQRQNRQRAIESKLIRAQEEQTRKIKMENQRRAAREAEGRPAKDGSLFMASQSPSTAWINLSSDSNAISIAQSEPTYSESEEAGSARQEVSALSEEEQVRHAMKETETWNVVKGKEKRNRASKCDDSKTFIETKTQETTNVIPTSSAPVESDRLNSPYYSIKERGQFNDQNIVLEDSEWEVS